MISSFLLNLQYI